MNNFVSDPLWTEEPQPELMPARADERKPRPARLQAVATENQSERLQRVAGNAALARKAEEALAAKARATEAASKPAPTAADKKEAARPQPKLPPEPAPIPAEKAKAAARAVALAAVLAHFERDAGRADLLGLARLAEDAPTGIAEAMAQTLAQAVIRADPAQRTAIAACLKSRLGDHPELRLAKLLAGRLAFLATPPRAAPPPPPPPAPP